MDLAELTKIYNFSGRSVVVTGGTGVLGAHGQSPGRLRR